MRILRAIDLVLYGVRYEPVRYGLVEVAICTIRLLAGSPASDTKYDLSMSFRLGEFYSAQSD